MLAIYKRELKSYFQSMVGCVFVAFLLVFTGHLFCCHIICLRDIRIFSYFAGRISDRIYCRDSADHDAKLFSRKEK